MEPIQAENGSWVFNFDDVSVSHEKSTGPFKDDITTFKLLINGQYAGGIATLIHYSDHVSMLDGIDIPKNLQNKGLSHFLLQSVIDEIDQRGNIGYLGLASYQRDKADYLYQKYGFMPCSELSCKQTDFGTFCTQNYIREGKDFPKTDLKFQEARNRMCQY